MSAMGAASANDPSTESAPGYALFGLSGGYVFDEGPWWVHMFACVDNMADRACCRVGVRQRRKWAVL
jgi:iron complex outermembrane receptor protein